ncbi:MAG: Thiamine-phosphate synthase [Euryarchaeota archaeon ADurb.Bin165]|jgi:thiamine-phosphate pyrophosphorylase|uniref:thiamine phosphate synthase n=1 Tax=Methanospirillum sp. TaxID=45200 RepID=UPI0009D4BAD0|nr:thiamine phosphate synthase [Methanospirillum sp.]OQB37524.1 MAG: Thiamine-phosphate synthase [Euryarchaeota archaeon ADurb.Bin165]HQB99230.1 thiamine phosphate synthase [Methanospirillum sp.]
MERGLYVITDETLAPGCSHIHIAKESLSGGAKIIQLRDKHRNGGELFAIAREIRSLCTLHDARFIINDRLDIALAALADGVHLGQDDLPLSAARRLAPRPFIIGISVGTVEEAVLAEREGADYIGVGPVYPTGTKTDAGPAVGPDLVRAIRKEVTIPIVAIGGINLLNVRDVVTAGADWIAVISAVICSPDIEAASRKFVTLINS